MNPRISITPSDAAPNFYHVSYDGKLVGTVLLKKDKSSWGYSDSRSGPWTWGYLNSYQAIRTLLKSIGLKEAGKKKVLYPKKLGPVEYDHPDKKDPTMEGTQTSSAPSLPATFIPSDYGYPPYPTTPVIASVRGFTKTAGLKEKIDLLTNKYYALVEESGRGSFRLKTNESEEERWNGVRDMIAGLIEEDPTPNKIYLEWIVRQVGVNNVMEEEGEILDLLTRFEKAKKSRKIPTDINAYKTLGQLYDALETVEGEGGKDWEAGAPVVLDQPPYKVIRLDTQKAAAKLCKGTEWCVRAPNMYQQYAKQGPLYLVYKNGERYALVHYESGQVNDPTDQSFPKNEALALLHMLEPVSGQSVAKIEEKLRDRLSVDIDEWIEKLRRGRYDEVLGYGEGLSSDLAELMKDRWNSPTLAIFQGQSDLNYPLYDLLGEDILEEIIKEAEPIINKVIQDRIAQKPVLEPMQASIKGFTKTAKDAKIKPFYLDRKEDESGVSGTGKVAYGLVLPSGRAVIEWTTGHPSITIFNSIDELLAVHGHDGKTQVKYLKDTEGAITKRLLKKAQMQPGALLTGVSEPGSLVGTPQIEIDPTIAAEIEDAVQMLRAADPSFFHDISKIVAFHGSSFGQVSSEDPSVIHLNVQKIQGEVKAKLGSFDSNNPEHREAFEEAIKHALVEVITHEKGHVSDWDPEHHQFPGGEGVAEREVHVMMPRVFHSLMRGFCKVAQEVLGPELPYEKDPFGKEPTEVRVGPPVRLPTHMEVTMDLLHEIIDRGNEDELERFFYTLSPATQKLALEEIAKYHPLWQTSALYKRLSKSAQQHKTVIGIDIDGVIANTHDILMDIASEFVPVDEEDRTKYNIEDIKHGYPELRGQVFERVYERKAIADAPTMPHAVEKINEIFDAGHKVVLITARPKNWEEQTREWLKKIGLKHHTLIFCSNEAKGEKAKEEGVQVFIEDKPENLESIAEHGIRVYAFEQPWNKDVDVPHITDWRNVKAAFPPVIEKTRTREEKYQMCPHCDDEIREKSLYNDGDHWYHRPCKDKGPILFEKDGRETIFGGLDLPRLHGWKNVKADFDKIFQIHTLQRLKDKVNQLQGFVPHTHITDYLNQIQIWDQYPSRGFGTAQPRKQELNAFENALDRQLHETQDLRKMVQHVSDTNTGTMSPKEMEDIFGIEIAGTFRGFTKFSAPRWTTEEKNRLKDLYIKYRERGYPHHIIYKAVAHLLNKSWVAVKQKLETMYDIDNDLKPMKYEHWDKGRIDQMLQELYRGGQDINRLGLPATLMYQITNHSKPKAETCGFPAYYDSFDYAVASNILAVGLEREGDKLTDKPIKTLEEAIKYYRRQEKLAHAWTKNEIVALFREAHVAGLPLTCSFFKSHPNIYMPLLGVGRSLEGLKDSVKRNGYSWADLVVEAAPEYVDLYNDEGKLKSSTEELRIRRFLEINNIPFRVATIQDKIAVSDPVLLELGYKHFVPDFFILDQRGSIQGLVEVFGSIADSAASNTAEIYREKRQAKENFYKTLPYRFVAINNNSDGVDLTDEILQEKFNYFLQG